MYVIRGRNAAELWPRGIRLLSQYGEWEETRNGQALVLPEPCTIVYERPQECVILDPVRDNNPIFGLHESLFFLAGRDDAAFLDQFVSDFGQRFAEPDGRIHGSYGKRWRGWFSDNHGDYHPNNFLDQIDVVVRLLRENPADRQAVLTMWDPSSDLGVPGLKDRPCNMQIALRVRMSDRAPNFGESLRALDITVFCRSNDLVFGTFGANCVHFAVLQQYLAARIGVGVGTYRQVSNNLHIYENTQAKASPRSAQEHAAPPYPGTRSLIDDPDAFDDEVREYCERPKLLKRYRNSFLTEVAQPQFLANEARKDRSWAAALGLAEHIQAPDWGRATVEWLERRACRAGAM